VRFLRAAFAAFFRLLPVSPSEGDLEGAGERVRRSLPANFAVVALNGLCFPTAGRILGAGLLLTWFVSDLSDSAFLVGLIAPIQYGLALVAQPLVAGWLTAKPRRAPYYTAQSLVRAASWCALGVAAWVFGRERPALLLSVFFLVVVVDAVAAGVGNIAFSDTLARVIPRRLRGRARSWRGILGGLAAGAAALLIRSYFSGRGGAGAFGLLFAAAGVLYAAGGLIFIVIDEPEVAGATKEKPLLSDLRHKAGELWRDETFRRFVYAEVLLVPLTQALPFFTLFARRGFRIEVESLGLLVLVDAAAPVAGSLVWGRLADAFGNRRAVAGAALCGLLAPAISFALYAAGEAWSAMLTLALFACVVFTVGIAQTGIDLATKNYLLDLASDEAARPLYIGFNDALVGLPTMLLVAAGVVIDLFGFLPVFIVLVVLTMAGVLLALRLPSAGGKGTGT
jgi:hypothetical protein